MHLVLMKHNKGTAPGHQSNRLVLPHHCPPPKSTFHVIIEPVHNCHISRYLGERTHLVTAYPSFLKAKLTRNGPSPCGLQGKDSWTGVRIFMTKIRVASLISPTPVCSAPPNPCALAASTTPRALGWCRNPQERRPGTRQQRDQVVRPFFPCATCTDTPSAEESRST